jgi:hypothetical protein
MLFCYLKVVLNFSTSKNSPQFFAAPKTSLIILLSKRHLQFSTFSKNFPFFYNPKNSPHFYSLPQNSPIFPHPQKLPLFFHTIKFFLLSKNHPFLVFASTIAVGIFFFAAHRVDARFVQGLVATYEQGIGNFRFLFNFKMNFDFQDLLSIFTQLAPFFTFWSLFSQSLSLTKDCVKIARMMMTICQ